MPVHSQLRLLQQDSEGQAATPPAGVERGRTLWVTRVYADKGGEPQECHPVASSRFFSLLRVLCQKAQPDALELPLT